MIIGIGGVSRAGKTSLALKIQEWKGADKVKIIQQDDFIQALEQMPIIQGHIDWEHPDSLHFENLLEEIKKARKKYEIVVVEGLMVFWNKKLTKLMDKKIYLKITKSTFLARKTLDNRWGNEPEWYIEHIWNSHFVYGLFNHLPDVLQLDGELNNYNGRVKSYLGF